MQMCGHLLPQSVSIYDDNNTAVVASVTAVAQLFHLILWWIFSLQFSDGDWENISFPVWVKFESVYQSKHPQKKDSEK